MNDKQKKRKIICTVCLVAVAIISILLVVIVLVNGSDAVELFGLNGIRAETLYTVMIFLLILPVVLIMLAISMLVDIKKGKKPQTIKVENVSVNGNGKPVKPVSNVPTPTERSTPVKQTSATDGDEGEEAENEGASRFCKLTQLDEIRSNFQKENYDKNVTLRQFCENFRNYAASKLKLYYDISDIRRFVAGLAVSKILILQGMSGTGKTSLAHAFGEFVDNQSTVIAVQPMWKERTDLIGYYNEFTRRFNETTLLEKMYEANYSKDMYVTVLDEMNIARVEYYFAEFLSLLELPNAEERLLTVVTDIWENDPVSLIEGKVKLPENMWFIGTVNNDDSTFAISDKVYDRAMIMNLDMKAEAFTAPKTGHTRISAKQFERLAAQAMREYEVTARNMRRIEELDAYLIEHFQITFGNRIMKQIKNYVPVYVACGGTELDALDDILSKKVLRKLEMQNPIYLRSASAGLCSYIDELFGDDKMPLCKAFMQRLQRTI